MQFPSIAAAAVFHYGRKRYTVPPASTQTESEMLANEMKRGLLGNLLIFLC